MKKHITVIAIEENAVSNYVSQLREFFGNSVQVTGCCTSRGQIGETIRADLVAISVPDVTPYIEEHLPADVPIIYITRSFSKEKTAALGNLKPGSRVLLADYSENFANETMGVLNSIGYQGFNYVLCYPENKNRIFENISCAVVTGDTVCAPSGIERIIDIGWYLISPTTMLEITQRLGLMDSAMGSRLYAYFQTTHVVDAGIFQVFQSFFQLESQWESILNMVSGGVLLLDPSGSIIRYNDFIRGLCRKKGEQIEESLTGCDIHQLLYDEILNMIDQYETLDNDLLELPGGRKVTLSKRKLTSCSDRGRDLILIEDASEIQKAEHDIRLQLAQKGLSAKYTFEKIIGESPAMKRCITQCRKIAGYDTAVLISGDSGVGKELLAQSIHNASARRNMPFVAINCAALPADLLESELFGYEEGAFTGAKKGGKKGLMEMAHRGTIFLDEIGDMPLPVQAKLLRVLQEKEIMKIGSDYMLPVDIRIIAASNADFQSLLEEKRFRRDLYYRLNGIHIYVPPLAAREGDVLALAHHFIKKYPGKYFSAEILKVFPCLQWEGNVRQLEHSIEYMAIMGQQELGIEDLPPEIYGQVKELQEQNIAEADGAKTDERLTGFLPREKEMAHKIMEALKLRPLGRRRLTQVLAEEGCRVSEYQVRRLLDMMEKKGLIKINPTRKGIELL